MAMPWPPPTHIDSRPKVLPVSSSAFSSVVMMRAPVWPKGWPRAMAPPLHVQLVVADAELLGRGDDLGGEGLVDLHQVDVVDGHAGPTQHLADGVDRTEAHDLGIETGDAAGHDAGQRGDAELAGLGVAHHDDGGGAVVERAGVAGGDGPTLPEHRVEGGQLLERGAGAGVRRPWSPRCRRPA